MKRILILNFLFFIIYSCVPNSPELPEWETKWSIYLPLKDFTMVEAINDSTVYADTTDSGIPILKFELSDTTDRNEIKRSDLGIGGSTDHFSENIGEFEVVDEETVTLDPVSVWELLSIDSSLIGNTLPPYPDAEANPPAQKTEFTKFLMVGINKGNLIVTFHNNTFISIRTGMAISVYNDSINNNLVGTAVFNHPIPAGTTVQSEAVDLTDVTMYNKLELQYSIPVQGSDTEQTITPEEKNSSFFVDLSVHKLVVHSTVAKIPVLEYDGRDSIKIEEEDVKLKRGLIDEGSIQFTLTNLLPLSANVEIELPDIVKDGNPLVIQYHLPASDNDTKKIDISGYELFNHQYPGSYVDYIYYNVKSKTDSTEGYTEVTSADSVVVDVERDSLILSQFEGEIIDQITFNFDPVEMDGMDIFDDIEGEIRLNALKMVLEVQNEINIPIYFDMVITGYKIEEQTNQILDSVRIELKDQYIAPSGISEKTIITLDKDSQSPSIVDMIAIKPTDIKVSGSGYVLGEGSASVGDGVQVVYRVESPLTIYLSDSLHVDTNIETLTDEDIDEDLREQITEDLLDVSIDIDFENSLPLGVDALVIFATDSTDLYSIDISDSSKKIIIDELISAGTVGSSGYVDMPSIEKINISLSKTQLQIFDTLPIYIRQVYKVPPTNSDVSFRQSDGVTIDGKISFKILTNTK